MSKIKCTQCDKLIDTKTNRCNSCGSRYNPDTGEITSTVLSDGEIKELFDQARKEETISKIVVGVLLAPAAIFILSGNIVLIVIAILFIIVSILAFFLFKDNASNVLKNTVVRNTIGQMFNNAEFHPSFRINKERAMTTKRIIPFYWESVSGDNYLKATHRDITFELSNVRLYYEETNYNDSTNANDTESYTVALGQWLTCQLTKDFPVSINVRKIINDKKDKRTRWKHPLPSISTGDTLFDQTYEVTSEDTYAGQSITPEFMNAIRGIDRITGGNFYIGTRDNFLHILTDNKQKAFQIEASKYSAHNLDGIRQRIAGQVNYMTSMVDEIANNL